MNLGTWDMASALVAIGLTMLIVLIGAIVTLVMLQATSRLGKALVLLGSLLLLAFGAGAVALSGVE